MKKTVLVFCFLLLIFVCANAAFAEETVRINELCASNGTYTNGHAYDWVELYNASGKTVDLSGWYLSDSLKNREKWTFPENTKIKSGEYVLIYCTGENLNLGGNGVYYANFKLSASGDQVILSDNFGQEIDLLSFGAQYGNVSFGLAEGSEETYGFFETSTPGKKNEKTVFEIRCDTPVLTTPGGFYEEEITVFASAGEGDTLRYTLDGATPTLNSPLFPQEGLTLHKTSALRVKAFHENKLSSADTAATYFFGESFPVAVVSLTTDEKYLYDSKTGALVKGTSSSFPNYEKDLEYPVFIEYFDESGQCLIRQTGTFTAAGHSARQNAQKSIALYARKSLGEEYFNFNPFPNRDYPYYKSLLLRSTNSDAFSTRLRDVVFSSLAENLSLCYQDARPIVVFINGEYRGHYNLREKINKYMVAAWEGISLEEEETVENIDILARTGSDDYVQNGSNEDWLALCDFCKTTDLNDPAALYYVESQLDIGSLFEHVAFEIIIGNTDITNVRVYRVPGGKWKYLLFDVEAGFGSSSDKNTSPLEYYIKDVSAKIQAFRHEPLNALLQVPSMKARFLTTFANVLQTCFQWPYVESKFAPWEAVLEELLPRQNERWPYLTMKEWRQNVNATKYYARVRPKKVVSWLASRMKLTAEEVETYLGDVQRLLEETNTLP